MSRRDRDWNRPIPQRQQNQARASSLLRNVAGDMLPEPAPEPPEPPAPPRRSIYDDWIRGGNSFFDERDIFNLRSAAATSTRASGNTTANRDDLTRYLRMFAGTVGNGTTTVHPPITRAAGHDFYETITPARATPFEDAVAAYEPVQIVRLYTQARTHSFIPRRRLSQDDFRSLSDLAPRVFNEQVNRAGERIRQQIQENVERGVDIQTNMERLNPILFTPSGGSHTEADRFRVHLDEQGRMTATSVVPDASTEKRYTVDEIKAWLKENLEVKVAVADNAGELSVQTTILIDGEEITSDSDFVQIWDPNHE